MRAMHQCAANGCIEVIPTGLLLCDAHWRMLTWSECVRLLAIDTIEHDLTWDQKKHLYGKPVNKILLDLASREIRKERVN